MDTQDIVDKWRHEAVQEGVQQGRAEGVQQGRAQGVAQSVLAVYEARFGAMPDELRALVEATDDGPTLASWLRIASTRSASEIAAAIRAQRAS